MIFTDLNKQARRSQQRTVYATRDEYQTPSFHRLGPAGEQFLKETPWANPNHSSHRIQQQQQQQYHHHHQPQHRIQPVHADGKPEKQALNGASLSTAAIPGNGGPTSQRSPEVSRTPLKTANPMKRTALPGPSRESKTAAA
jgi:hypothetical protein